MMCARLLRAETRGKARPLLPARTGGFFKRMLARVRPQPAMGVAASAIHAHRRRRHVGRDGSALRLRPERTAAAAGHRPDHRRHGRRADPFRSRRWSSGSARLPRSCGSDPDVQSVASFVGAGTVNATVNSGRLYINLKPRDQRKRQRPARSSNACATPRATSKGISLFMQAAQDVQIDSRVSRTQYQYTLQDADAPNSPSGRRSCWQKLAHLPELADVASDQQANGLQVSVNVDREKASRLQRPAPGD